MLHPLKPRVPIIPMRLSLITLLLVAILRAQPVEENKAPIDTRILIPENQVTLAAVEKSITRGVDYLVKKQNPDGSFGGATRTKGLNIYAPLPGAHHAFLAGASGLALSGVLDAQDQRPEVAACVKKGQDWLFQKLPELRRADLTTTYNVWGHAYGLRALCRLHTITADPTQKQKIITLAKDQIDIANRYEDLNGGWGYLDIYDGLHTQKPSGITTSFTSATMLLAMREARDQLGCSLSPKVIKSTIASINLQRFPDNTYAYSHGHHINPQGEINRRNGSLSRSVACNATLRAYGDTSTITDEVIKTWCDNFIEFEKWLDHGRKKPRPHESTFKISGYFYYYGIYYFTESARFLPAEQQRALAPKLARIILTRQEKDGDWWDYPLYDYHQPYGTGYALMALSWCREQMK